ncbi:hypothetical protein SCUP515_12329 [Seiridium cupressi]
MLSIEALPVELMQQIFSELSLESNRDLKSCRLVNHIWDSHATELLFYQVNYHPDTAKLFDQLRLQARELLWVLAVQQAEQDEEKVRAAEASRAIAISIFSVAFKHALPKFSNVHTFVSWLMDPCRKISTGENGMLDILDAVVKLMSDVPTLRQLYIADEGPYSTFVRYPPPCTAEVMLEKLTHIDLCFGIFEEEDMERLRGWLESATNLQYLRLCMGCCNSLNVTPQLASVLRPHVSRPICVYPHNDEGIPVPVSEEAGALRGVVAQGNNSFSPEDLDWRRRRSGTDLLTSIPTRCSSPIDGDVDMMNDKQCTSVDEYAREAIWDLRRWREAPRWLWSALGGDIYYWAVTDRDDIDNIGYPTEISKFTHNSEVAWGEEPFEFWEDWRGPESGDTAEPTPFGHRFTRFREIFDRYLECGEYVEDILHSHAIPLDRVVRYHRLLDPMLCTPRDTDILTSQWTSVLPWP